MAKRPARKDERSMSSFEDQNLTFIARENGEDVFAPMYFLACGHNYLERWAATPDQALARASTRIQFTAICNGSDSEPNV
jgi:hypothetical protein